MGNGAEGGRPLAVVSTGNGTTCCWTAPLGMPPNSDCPADGLGNKVGDELEGREGTEGINQPAVPNAKYAPEMEINCKIWKHMEIRKVMPPARPSLFCPTLLSAGEVCLPPFPFQNFALPGNYLLLLPPPSPICCSVTGAGVVVVISADDSSLGRCLPAMCHSIIPSTSSSPPPAIPSRPHLSRIPSRTLPPAQNCFRCLRSLRKKSICTHPALDCSKIASGNLFGGKVQRSWSQIYV